MYSLIIMRDHFRCMTHSSLNLHQIQISKGVVQNIGNGFVRINLSKMCGAKERKGTIRVLEACNGGFVVLFNSH